MRHHFFITGTDSGVGKTVLSALLCAAHEAGYWKPIQTGTLEGSDRVTVMRLAGIGTDRTLDEVYKFVPPVSPDLAARCGIAGAWRGAEWRAKPREPGNHRAIRPRPRHRRNSEAPESAPHRADASLHESFRSRRLCAIIAAWPNPGIQNGGVRFWLRLNRQAPAEQNKRRARNQEHTLAGGVAGAIEPEWMEAESRGVRERPGRAGAFTYFLSGFFGADVS